MIHATIEFRATINPFVILLSHVIEITLRLGARLHTRCIIDTNGNTATCTSNEWHLAVTAIYNTQRGFTLERI